MMGADDGFLQNTSRVDWMDSGLSSMAVSLLSSVVPSCPPASSESTRLHLVAVTADGRRVYFTTSALRYGQYYGGPTKQVRGDAGDEGVR